MTKHTPTFTATPIFKSVRTTEPDWRLSLTTKPVKLGRGSADRYRRKHKATHDLMARAQGRV